MTIQQALETIHQKSKMPLNSLTAQKVAVTLLAVSKTKPNEAILEAYHAGQKHLGRTTFKKVSIKFSILSTEYSA